jgi:hypothetical protein
LFSSHSTGTQTDFSQINPAPHSSSFEQETGDVAAWQRPFRQVPCSQALPSPHSAGTQADCSQIKPEPHSVSSEHATGDITASHLPKALHTNPSPHGFSSEQSDSSGCGVCSISFLHNPSLSHRNPISHDVSVQRSIQNPLAQTCDALAHGSAVEHRWMVSEFSSHPVKFNRQATDNSKKYFVLIKDPNHKTQKNRHQKRAGLISVKR